MSRETSPRLKTASFRPVIVAETLPATFTVTSSNVRSLKTILPAAIHSTASAQADEFAQVRNPSEPTLMPKTGLIRSPKLSDDIQNGAVTAEDDQQVRLPAEIGDGARRAQARQLRGFRFEQDGQLNAIELRGQRSNQFGHARLARVRDQADFRRTHIKNSWFPSAPVISERTMPDHIVTGVHDEVANLILRFLVQRRIANDPAVRDFRRLELKLRLDQRKDHTVGSYQVEGVRQD